METHVSQVVGSNGTYELEKAFTYAELQAEKAIRIQTEGSTELYSVDSILITRIPAAPSAAPASSSPGAVVGEVFITFSAADKARWAERFSLNIPGNVSLEWVSNFGKGDSFSLKGSHVASSTDYTGALNAIRLSFDKPLAKNAATPSPMMSSCQPRQYR